MLQQESCGDQPQESLLDERENNNVLIKEVTAGLTQPEWGRRRVALSPTTPKRDSRAVVLGPPCNKYSDTFPLHSLVERPSRLFI